MYCACGSLFSPRVTLEIQQEEQQENGWLMVMADPLDLGHGKNGANIVATLSAWTIKL